MKGLVNEEKIMESGEAGVMRDAGVLSAGQKVEHFDNESYERLRQFAQLIGLTEAAPLSKADADPSEGAPSIT